MFKTIVVPLDGSPRAEQALEPAVQLALSQGGRLRLVQACPGPVGADYAVDITLRPPLLERDRQEVTQYLERLTERFRDRGVQMESKVLPWGDPAQRVLEELESEPADLIVINSHGRSGLARFLLGSVAEKIARHSPCPVLIIRQ